MAASVRARELGASPLRVGESLEIAERDRGHWLGNECQEAIDIGTVSALCAWRGTVQPQVDEVPFIVGLPWYCQRRL